MALHWRRNQAERGEERGVVVAIPTSPICRQRFVGSLFQFQSTFALNRCGLVRFAKNALYIFRT